ncbi:aspartate/glutamate racemase family protein [Streptomyces olivaceus]|uniref:aspartate/glutamate racemase family protein n=1 Tax=Streptomyces olivaceus TaxID=47716 RepID=UPI001CCCDE7E|nr:AroM family protein [Streptomyces olivaceus]MBZ6258724.1 aspartate/glutamate racemase family protein [Streptomyces olivaceus]
MTASFVGIVRVLTSDDPAVVEDHGRLLRRRYGFPVESRCIPDQPNGIHDDATHSAAEPKIVALARELERDGADTVVISCAADPALDAVRTAVDVPVVGAGSAAAGLALSLGRRVGVLGIRDETPQAIAHPLGAHLVASGRPRGVHSTVHLRTPEGTQATEEAAARLVEAGADCLVLACTGFTSIGIRPALERRLGVPVVDAVLAAGLVATYRRDG